MTTLSRPDPYGTRWTPCHTIAVRPERTQQPDGPPRVTGWEVRDDIAGMTYSRSTLVGARARVESILAERPKLDFSPWERHRSEHQRWWTCDAPDMVLVTITDASASWWVVEIAVHGVPLHFGWHTDRTRTLASVQAEALAWATRYAIQAWRP